jgi:hypothetical protein
MGLPLYNANNQTDQKVSTMDRLSAMQAAQSNLREHQSGLEYLSALLRGAKSEIQNHGFISERLRRKIFSVFCFCDYSFALACVSAAPARAGTNDFPSKTEISNADVLALIEDRLGRLGMFKEYVLEREGLAVDAAARSLSLPSAGAADKLLRYETHLDRQVYRAIDKLERLQRH